MLSSIDIVLYLIYQLPSWGNLWGDILFSGGVWTIVIASFANTLQTRIMLSFFDSEDSDNDIVLIPVPSYRVLRFGNREGKTSIPTLFLCIAGDWLSHRYSNRAEWTETTHCRSRFLPKKISPREWEDPSRSLYVHRRVPVSHRAAWCSLVAGLSWQPAWCSLLLSSFPYREIIIRCKCTR